MTGQSTPDLDITLIKGGERQRFAIETRGPSEWAVTIEVLAPLLRTSTFVLTSADAVRQQRAALMREAEAMILEGWSELVVPNDAFDGRAEEPPPS